MEIKFTKSDLRISIIFFLFAIVIGSMDYEEYPDDKKYLLIIDHINFILFTSFSVYILIFVLFAKYFPKGEYLKLLLFGLGFLMIIGELEIQWYCFFNKCHGNLLSINIIYQGLISHIESVGIFGTFLLGKKLYDTQVHFVAMEKEKREAELQFLKSQIDPHFLFNNLNTVDSLIDTNPQAAKIYLNKLSHLYRYLISSKDFEVVPLEEELEFARNYMYLIESRFGDAFQFEIKNNIQDKEVHLIPPGALQTLLENIVKHNHGSSMAPIRTIISISENTISISNNIKTKNSKVDSTGIGLTNLKSRYKLLTDKDIEIQSNESFTVNLPSIKQVA